MSRARTVTGMPSNPPILLLDTNVWLDLFLPHRPGGPAAAELIEAAEASGASLAYPSHALLDVYQKVRSDNKRWIRQSRPLTETDALAIKRMAWDFVDIMRRIATAISCDLNDVDLACTFRDGHDDLENDLVLAACQRAHANYLVTTDARLASHAPLEAKSPQGMTELLRSGRARSTSTTRDAASDTEWLYEWLSTWGNQDS